MFQKYILSMRMEDGFLPNRKVHGKTRILLAFQLLIQVHQVALCVCVLFSLLIICIHMHMMSSAWNRFML